MNIAIIYDSSTGTTAKAAGAMGRVMEEHGHKCRVQSVGEADPVGVSEADLICIGTWVQGLFIILQHPTQGTMNFIERMGNLADKKVVGQFKYRGPETNSSFTSFASSLA